MGYGGGGGGGGGSGGGGSGSGGSGGSGAGGASGYRRVGDDRTANLKVDNITSRDGSRGTEVDGIVEVNTTAHFIPPSGTTAERNSRGRGLFGGGYGASSPYPEMNVIDYITIATLGNASDFGDYSVARSASGCGNSTRGLFVGGRFSPTSSEYNIIDFVTISSTGNAFDFGDLTKVNPDPECCANNIRGVFNGGYVNPGASGLEYKSIEFVTIASLGNSSNFGDSTIAGRRSFSGSNSVRGIWAGVRSNTPSPGTRHNNIDYITMATLGDALDFGDLTVARTNSTGSSTSSTRMVMQNGLIVGGSVNIIDYITMASTGDAIDFGDVANTGTAEANAAVSSLTRGVIRSGGGAANNTLEYITIATLGNGQDFGDLNTGRRVYGSFSDSHGGLG